MHLGCHPSRPNDPSLDGLAHISAEHVESRPLSACYVAYNCFMTLARNAVFDGIAHICKEQAVWPQTLENESFLSSPVFTIRRITSNVNNSVVITMNSHHAMVSSSSYIFLIHHTTSLNKQTVKTPIPDTSLANMFQSEPQVTWTPI